MLKKLSLIALIALPSLSANYIGFSVIALQDTEEPFFATRLGMSFNESEDYSHNAEIEVGAYSDEGPMVFDRTIEIDVIPVLANYRFRLTPAGGLVVVAGVGIGGAIVNTEVPAFGVDEQIVFTGQAFVGGGYQFGDTYELLASARYLALDDVEAAGIDLDVAHGFGAELSFAIHF